MRLPEPAHSSAMHESDDSRSCPRMGHSRLLLCLAIALLLATESCDRSFDRKPDRGLATVPAMAPRTGRHLLLVVEPGVCFGCMRVPAAVEALRTVDAAHVTYLWRRAPTKRERRSAAPLRLPISGVLPTPWPIGTPAALVAVLYVDGRPTLIDSVGNPQLLDSMARQIIRVTKSGDYVAPAGEPSMIRKN